MMTLLLVESLSKTDPKSTAKQDAKNGNNDGLGFGAAVFRVIKAWTPIVNVLVFHEQTRERAHVQQYAVTGIPCQGFFLDFVFFLSRFGLPLTFATVSR